MPVPRSSWIDPPLDDDPLQIHFGCEAIKILFRSGAENALGVAGQDPDLGYIRELEFFGEFLQCAGSEMSVDPPDNAA